MRLPPPPPSLRPDPKRISQSPFVKNGDLAADALSWRLCVPWVTRASTSPPSQGEDRLSIRLRTATIVSVTMLVLTLVLVVGTRREIDAAFAGLERRDTEKSVRLSLNWVASQGPPLAATAAGYGNWDDTLRFVVDRSPDYVRRNLQNGELVTLGLDFMVFLDTRGHVVHVKVIDRTSGSSQGLSEGLVAFLQGQPAALRFRDPRTTMSGLVALPSGLAIVGASPITNNEATGSIRGTVLVGYLLRESRVGGLTKATGADVSWFSLAAPIPADIAAARIAAPTSHAIIVRPLDGGTVAGYGVLDDIQGQPGVAVKVTLQRSIVARGHTVIVYAIIGLLGFVVISVFTLIAVLDRSVLARLAGLNKQVKEVEASEQPGVRLTVRGRDEIAQLANGINGMLGALERSQTKLIEMATTDALTGVNNRRRFEEELARELLEQERLGRGGALLWFDLDKFKDVNDVFGHAAGDEMLIAFAEALRSETRRYSALARLGGDEFAMLLPGASESEALQAAERLLAVSLSLQFSIRGREVGLSTSIGVALYPRDGATVDGLMAAADTAMYEAKRTGRGRVCVAAVEPAT